MRTVLSFSLAVAVLLCLQPQLGASPATAQDLPANVEHVETYRGVAQYRLKSNGMTILLSENHAAPVFTFLVVYHVGSRNEAPGNTGSAHLLEHLIFNKSTENFGKARGHKTFQEVLYEAGASFRSTNMTTWNDRMTGYSTLPSDKLELAMRIEADRLKRGLILDEERQPEMSVVRNEYEIGENDPSNALYKAVIGAAVVAHPYHWDTIGYRSDIENVSTEKLREHYETYFHPDNSEAVLVGDFDPSEALAMFDREFGAFSRSEKPIPEVTTVEPPQEGERRVVVKRPGSVGLVQIAYMRPEAVHPDFMAFDVLNGILTEGVNARLHQALVETGIASSVTGYNFAFRDPYPILFEAWVAPDATHDDVEGSIRQAIALVASDGVTTVELERAQKQLEVSAIRNQDGAYALANSLGEAVASTNWKWLLGYIDAMNAVTAADVQRVASTYLIADRATVGWFVPVDPAEAPRADTSDESTAGSQPTESGAARARMADQAGTTGSDTAASARTTASAQATTGSFGERTLRRSLANGITLDIVENHAAPTVALHGRLAAGGITSPTDNPALADLTAIMVERGTTTRDKNAIGALLDGAGASLSISGGLLETVITGSALAGDVDLLVDILAEQLLTPAFPDTEYAKALAEYRSSVLRQAESTSLRGIERLAQLVFPKGHPHHLQSADVLIAAAEATSLDEIREFHRLRYVGASLVLAVAGDVDAEAVAAKIESALGVLPRGERPVLDLPRVSFNDPDRVAVTMPGKANMNFLYGHAAALRRTDADYEAALIANAAVGQTSLSSRIGKQVRDTEGLSYSLYSRFRYADVLDGMWMVNVAVAPQNLERALVSTREVFTEYCREGITDEEVKVQKSFFAGNYQVSLGSNAGVAAALTDAAKFGFGPDYLDAFPNRMRAVTRDQVNAAIREHLSADRIHLVVAGDIETLPE